MKPDTLIIRLESQLDQDLCTRILHRSIKTTIQDVVNIAGVKTEDARLECWIDEVQKIAEECGNDLRRYRKAVEDNRMSKHQALSGPSCNSNTSSSL